MRFDKIAEQNTWDEVEQATQDVRSGNVPNPRLLQWFSEHGVELAGSVFPCIGVFDDNVFSGTLVSQDRRVYEYFVDMDDPEDAEFEDVTDQLGPKEPGHPNSDVKDPITMSLVFFDAQQGRAA